MNIAIKWPSEVIIGTKSSLIWNTPVIKTGLESGEMADLSVRILIPEDQEDESVIWMVKLLLIKYNRNFPSKISMEVILENH